jgi:hypothetical protein
MKAPKSGLRSASNKAIFFVLLQLLWTTGFSQSLSLKNLGDVFQRTNLDVLFSAGNLLQTSPAWGWRWR